MCIVVNPTASDASATRSLFIQKLSHFQELVHSRMTTWRPSVDLHVMRLSWSGLALGVVTFVVGCSHPAAAPPPKTATTEAPLPADVAPAQDLTPNTLHDRRTDAGVRAAAKPLVIGSAGSAKCGKLSMGDKKTPAAEPADLLDGRLKIRAPSGAKAPAAQPDQPPTGEESRLVVDVPAKAKAPEDKVALAIVAKETFQLDPDMYEPEADAPSKPGSLDTEAPKFLKATMPSEQPLDVVPVEVGESKLRGYVARPKDPNAAPGKDTALVLGLLVAQDDGTLESIGFYVRGEAVRNATGSDLVGCTRLAERIAATIVPGARKLERTAGKRHIADVPPEDELTVSVPADYVVVPTQTGAKVTKLRPISLYPGSIVITLADQKKQNAPDNADATAKGKLLGHPTEWKGQTSAKGGFFFTSEPLDSKTKVAEVLVRATRQAKSLDEMRGVAETLTETKRAK